MYIKLMPTVGHQNFWTESKGVQLSVKDVCIRNSYSA